MAEDPARKGLDADPAHASAICRFATDRARPHTTTVLAIDGPAGSGKTSLATLVSERLDAPTVHMDDLFPGWDGLAAAPALLAAQILAPLSRRETACFRRFDWIAGEFAELVEVPSGTYLIVEGCGSSVGIARSYAAVRVWVEAGTDVRKRRGLDRDGDLFAPHWERWARQEATMYAADRTRARADLRFCTDERPGP